MPSSVSSGGKSFHIFISEPLRYAFFNDFLKNANLYRQMHRKGTNQSDIGRSHLACLLGNGIESAWLATGQHGGYDFVPLLTLDDFLDESRSMHNCLDQYADRLATGLIRIFSIRQGGIPVADIEIGPTPAKAETPSIVQIKARNNRQAPLAV
ncbi:MAG: hypothetical protein EX260_11165, partial [Desulfobulbaceae bacterium]